MQRAAQGEAKPKEEGGVKKMVRFFRFYFPPSSFFPNLVSGELFGCCANFDARFRELFEIICHWGTFLCRFIVENLFKDVTRCILLAMCLFS